MASPPPRRQLSSTRSAWPVACGGASMEWSSLPADLLLAVFALLPADADRVRFRAVCATWGAAAACWRPRPWLVGSRTDRSGQGAAMSSFWLSQSGGLVPFAAAVPPGMEHLSSSHGYLVLSDPTASQKAITLLNPVTGRCIPLPPIGFFRKWHDVATVVLSADPGAAAEWTAVAAGFPTNCLAYYSSVTGAWTAMDFSVAGYAGVDHYRGRFYVAFKSQLCVICEPGGGAAPAVIPLEHVDGDVVGSDGENVPGSGGRRIVVDTHLVECDGELLLVSVHDEAEYSSDDDMGVAAAVDDGGNSTAGGRTRVVEVHRVEWVGDGAVRLVRAEDIGWNALFLGRNRAFALSPAEFPTCRVNCVYLLDRQGHPDGLVRVVDMESQWARREDTIYPDDGRRGSPSAGWARREETIYPDDGRRGSPSAGWARREETIYPDDGRRGSPSAGWARRGWFFPSYTS